MANKLTSKAPRESKLDATVIMAVVVCVVAAAAFAYWRMGPGRPIGQEDFQFSKLEIDHKKLEDQRHKKYAKANLQDVQSEWQELLATARKANQAQFGEVGREEQLTLSAEMRVWANEVLLGSGLDSFVVTGEPIFRECNGAVDELLGAIRRGELTVEEAKTDPPADTFGTYRANCGNLLPTLLARGLVTDGGKWTSEDAPVIVDILSRYRWAHIIHDQKDPWAQLTREGARAFSRWRVEQASGYSLAQRRQFLDKLVSQFPDYNATFTAGVLAYRAGELDVALDHFETLAQNQPRSDYKKYVEFLREKSGNSDQEPAESAPEAGPAAAEKTD
jgi:hypothetical protein